MQNIEARKFDERQNEQVMGYHIELNNHNPFGGFGPKIGRKDWRELRVYWGKRRYMHIRDIEIGQEYFDKIKKYDGYVVLRAGKPNDKGERSLTIKSPANAVRIAIK